MNDHVSRRLNNFHIMDNRLECAQRLDEQSVQIKFEINYGESELNKKFGFL